MYTYIIHNLQKIMGMFECVFENVSHSKKIAWEQLNDTILRNIYHYRFV